MPVAPLRLIRRCFELAPQSDVELVPADTRGMYVLYKRYRRPTNLDRGRARFDVVYVGIASSGRVGVRQRLRSHWRRKGAEWTHFSVFEGHENIRNDEIKELEGLFRHIYRFDARANRLNVAKGYLALAAVRRSAAREGWMHDAESDLPVRGRS